jgi:hypothetical protein
MPRAREPSSIRSDCALVEPALHDARILSGRIFGRLGRRGSFGLSALPGVRLRGDFLDTSHLKLARLVFSRGRLSRLSACCLGAGRGRRASAGGGRRRIWCRLAVSDELVVARSAGPRRRIGRQAAGPMRPAIGDIAAERTARAKHCAEPQQRACGNEPFDNHVGRRVVGPARRMHRAPLTILSDRVAGH